MRHWVWCLFMFKIKMQIIKSHNNSFPSLIHFIWLDGNTLLISYAYFMLNCDKLLLHNHLFSSKYIVSKILKYFNLSFIHTPQHNLFLKIYLKRKINFNNLSLCIIGGLKKNKKKNHYYINGIFRYS